MNAQKVLTQQDRHFLIELVDAAGRAIMDIYNQKDSPGHILKSDNSPLTQADLKANQILTAGLRDRFPGIPVLSEEESNAFAPGERPTMFWAVDPLDGTKEFINRNGEFTVNISLVVDGSPRLGLVGAPALGLLYFGSFGGACDFDDKALMRDKKGWRDIHVSGSNGAPSLNPLRIAISRSHPSVELDKWLKQFAKSETKEMGSSLKFCLVAEGLVDVYPRFGPTCIWDTAAGHAIVVAAGGRVLQLDGTPLLYKEPAQPLNPSFIASADSFLVN
jgi:3'(2'), 5'-bisphosphate nucleotidase